MTEQSPHPKVFLSYASEDREVAIKIAEVLERRDVHVQYDLSVPLGECLLDYISELISASDYVVVLLSPNTMKSGWVQYAVDTALNKDLTKRGVTVMPVLIEGTFVHPTLLRYAFLDFRGNIEQGVEWLAARLKIAPDIDFSRLSWEQFEDLVADLLVKLGFKYVEKQVRLKGYRFDIKAEYVRIDPFGVSVSETWLVECKFYQRSRANLKAIQEFLFSLSKLRPDIHGLLVMNSQLTSAAQEYLELLEGELRANVHVVDGTELKGLLIKHEGFNRKIFYTG
jgi:hypothetical protein